MAVCILVHGGNISTDSWNRQRNRNDYPPGGLLGARYWDGTKTYLESHGHRVFAPALYDEHSHNLTDHIDQVCSIIAKENLRNIILVGHSYGGMVITGVADRVPKAIRRLVYIDAALPDPGQSLFDLFADGRVDPSSFPGLEAATAYVEKIRFDPQKIRRIHKSYVLCTKSEFADVTRAARQKVFAQADAGWSYTELPASHVPMATTPQRFYRLMLEMTGR
jgi:pimeloyl-ACP methyl ester carboxylesterase